MTIRIMTNGFVDSYLVRDDREVLLTGCTRERSFQFARDRADKTGEKLLDLTAPPAGEKETERG